MRESNSPTWMRGAQIGLGVIAIILSILVFVHPGITILSIIFILGIILIIVGIEKIISGIFITNKSRWGTIGLGILALIFGSIALGYPLHTAVFVIIMLGIGLLVIGIEIIVVGTSGRMKMMPSRGMQRKV